MRKESKVKAPVTESESAFIALTASKENLRNAIEGLYGDIILSGLKWKGDLTEFRCSNLMRKELGNKVFNGSYKPTESRRTRTRHINVPPEDAIVMYAVSNVIESYIRLFDVENHEQEVVRFEVPRGFQFAIFDDVVMRFLQSFDYDVFISVLHRRITDEKFLTLIRSLLVDNGFKMIDLDQHKGSRLIRLLYRMLLSDIRNVIEQGGGQFQLDSDFRWVAFFKSEEIARHVFFGIYQYLISLGLKIKVESNDEIVTSLHQGVSWNGRVLKSDLVKQPAREIDSQTFIQLFQSMMVEQAEELDSVRQALNKLLRALADKKIIDLE